MRLLCKHTRLPFLPLLLGVCLLLISFRVQGQTATEDVIYLKNGSIIRGKLLEYNAEGVARIETIGRNVLVFPAAEISRFSVEPVASGPARTPRDRREVSYKHRGYYNLTQVGLLLRSPDNNWAFGYEQAQTFNLQMVNGYRFNRFVQAGAGLGLSFYQRGFMLPVFGELRGDLLKAEITPHYYLSGGYAFPLYSGEGIYWEEADTRVRGGLMTDAGIGIKAHTGGAASWVLTVGYRTQQSENEYTDPWSRARIVENYSHRRLSLQLGMMF